MSVRKSQQSYFFYNIDNYKNQIAVFLCSIMLLAAIVRLHRMHEMLTILTDVRGVCLSVCHAV